MRKKTKTKKTCPSWKKCLQLQKSTCLHVSSADETRFRDAAVGLSTLSPINDHIKVQCYPITSTTSDYIGNNVTQTKEVRGTKSFLNQQNSLLEKVSPQHIFEKLRTSHIYTELYDPNSSCQYRVKTCRNPGLM